MKRSLSWVPMVACIWGVAALGAASPSQSLDQQLQSLNVPGNRAPSGVSSEKLYAVQTRYSPLQYRNEFLLGGAKNFNADAFMVSQQIDLGYRFHLSDRWSIGVSGSYVFNSLSEPGERLLDGKLVADRLFPDVAYPKYRADLTAGFNVFYGKLRLSMDQVFYFDQYVAAGPGFVWLDTGRETAAVGDVGLAFWFGQSASVRIGLKDYFFHEQRRLSTGYVHHLLGHFDIGYLL